MPKKNIENIYDNYEKLNQDYLNLLNSKEYKIGKNISNLNRNLKKLDFINTIKKLYVREKIKKLDNANEIEISYNDVDFSSKKIVVYTCLTGNYDNIIKPLANFDNVDYVLFTNNDNIKHDGWIKKNIPKNIKIDDNILINRYIKMHPAELFKNKYDYSIYIDSNIEVIGDIRQFIQSSSKSLGLAINSHNQRNCVYDEIKALIICKKGNKQKLEEFNKFLINRKFPKHFGLYECNVIATNLNNNNGIKILNEWWDLFVKSKTYRDQIELPYIIWNNNYKFTDIGIISKNIYLNAKVRFYKHKDKSEKS